MEREIILQTRRSYLGVLKASRGIRGAKIFSTYPPALRVPARVVLARQDRMPSLVIGTSDPCGNQRHRIGLKYIRQSFVRIQIPCASVIPSTLPRNPCNETTLTMADPLYLLRQSILASSLPTPICNDDPIEDLALATDLQFTSPTQITCLLTTPTRFVSSNGAAVDLRSIFFAWMHKDDPVPEYMAAAEALNSALGGGKIQSLGFIERLDLITWLEGASDDSEHIKPLEGGAAGALAHAQAASLAASGLAGTQAGRPARTVDPRLQQIYNNERRMGDRNTVLRGIKPTVRRHDPSSTRETSHLDCIIGLMCAI